MFGDAIKRLEYAVKQRPAAFVDAAGHPARAYWTLFETVQVMLHAIGQSTLADDLEQAVWAEFRGVVIDLFKVLRDHGIGTTPFDKLIPWTYRAIAADPAIVDVLAPWGAAIMQWQAATRTDINKLTPAQVVAAVQTWAPRPATHVGKVVYRFADGWTVQQLDTAAALKEEGRLMTHCVGGYCAEVAAGAKVIYSLRDPANVPRITLELDPTTARFKQIHGPANAAPTPEVQPYLAEVITRVFAGEPMGLLLAGVPATAVDLRNAHLAHANLAGADLYRADLTGADLADAKLRGAVLHAAILTNADLYLADLRGAILVDADLRYADLRRADLTGAKLTGAKLHGADFDEETTMPDGAKWQAPSGLGAGNVLGSAPMRKHGVHIIPHQRWNTKQVWANGHLMMTYRRVPKQRRFQHPMVNDANQDLCGGWHLDWDDENPKILARVAAGRKPLGIAHAIESRDEVAASARALTAAGLDVKITPHAYAGWNLAAAHPGTLADLFDLDALAHDYVASGAVAAGDMAREIARYADRTLISFAEGYDTDRVPPWVTGLILGYPVENTISLYLA